MDDFVLVTSMSSSSFMMDSTTCCKETWVDSTFLDILPSTKNTVTTTTGSTILPITKSTVLTVLFTTWCLVRIPETPKGGKCPVVTPYTNTKKVKASLLLLCRLHYSSMCQLAFDPASTEKCFQYFTRELDLMTITSLTSLSVYIHHVIDTDNIFECLGTSVGLHP